MPRVQLLPYQVADVNSHARFRWSCWARQTGKSFTKSLRRLLRGLERKRNQIFLSAGERQSRELMLKVRQHCQILRAATEVTGTGSFRMKRGRQLELLLPGGVRIIGLPANPETARGFTGDVLLDEFAMHTDDREIWGAMFPTLLRGDGELDIASTPRGCGNVFYDLARNDRFEHSTLTLPQAIAQGLPVDAAEIRAALGDELLYRQEFLCEFLDEAHAFLSWRDIAACARAGLRLCTTLEELATLGGELFVGVDIGRHRDLTVIWVLQADSTIHEASPAAGDAVSGAPVRSADPQPIAPRALCTVALFELAAAPFREQQALLHALLTLRGVRRCCIDAGGLGMQLAEEAVNRFGGHRVEAVTMTPALRSQIAGGLRIAVEGHGILIPQDERLFRDWHSVERSVSAAGTFRLEAPRREGSHADRFWAAALAVYAADNNTGETSITVGPPLTFAREGAW